MKSVSGEKRRVGHRVGDPDIIADIERYVAAKHGGNAKLTLYCSKVPSQKNTFHFVINSRIKLDISELPEITVYIQGKLDFLDVSVQRNDPWRQEIFQKDFTDSVEYTSDNSKNIKQFVDRNFPHFLSYQQQLKKHGCTFSESEKMEMEESEILGRAVLETCRQEVESHNLIDEADVASLLTNILKVTSERGFDPVKIVQNIDTSKLVHSVNK